MKKLTNTLHLLVDTIRHEVVSIASTPATILVMVGGVVLYGLLYNFLYRHIVDHEAPVAVVDDSHTPLSRHLIELVDATPQVEIVATARDMLEAHGIMAMGKAEGIIHIPSDLEKRIGRGEKALFVAEATTAEFLYYEAIQSGILSAVQAIDTSLVQQLVLQLPPNTAQSIAQSRPAQAVGVPLFNPTKGYATYLLPAVLIVIIFQTLLMVVCIRTGRERELGKKSFFNLSAHPENMTGKIGWGDAVAVVVGRMVVYVVLYGLFSLFLLGFLPAVFNLPHLAEWWELVAFYALFLPATVLCALFFSSLFRDSEAGILVIAPFSLGLILLSGLSYPLELMPTGWFLVHHLQPAPVGILGFVKLNSMGASLGECSHQLYVLAIQGVLYFILATLATFRLLNRLSK